MSSRASMTPSFDESCYSRILHKMDRALRNGRGCTLSHDDLIAILRSPAWMIIVEKEREELLALVETEQVDEGD